MKITSPATATGLVITSTVGGLSDRALLRQTSTLVRHERHLQGAIIDHLAEIETRRLFLQRGCSSLFDYAVRELGYSDAAAGRRLGAVRLCADQPDARERLRDGSLTLSAAAELQEALDRHDPSRPPRRARTGNRAAHGESEPARTAKERAAPEPVHAVTVQDAAIPADTTPTPERTPHPTPSSTPSQTRQEATDRRAAAATKPAGAATPTAKPCASGRAIPAAVKRQVWQRDGGRCSYLDRRTGRRCNSRHLIEIDHILPYALGGGADPANLRLLCEVRDNAESRSRRSHQARL
ncbi:MAG: hypothetical protein OXQ31_15810 [Spirochaetaceae bacterium]|nr:hypothetical protein [Spirochaetaceae bacterium]